MLLVCCRFDCGRFIQQSYYGRQDGSDWNGKPWRCDQQVTVNAHTSTCSRMLRQFAGESLCSIVHSSDAVPAYQGNGTSIMIEQACWQKLYDC